VTMVVKVHGSRTSRSPLVNWFLEETGVPYEDVAPKPSKHPFGQVPFLVDGRVEVFESGAILLYLADKYGEHADTPEQRAKFSKWVLWANSSLDPICFVENDRGGVVDTKLDKPGTKLKLLEGILRKHTWLVDDTFSVADVAVAAYLNYVPLFFPDVDLTATPAIAKYMATCAKRDAFVKAFGQDHADKVVFAADGAINAAASSSINPSKLFGIFEF